ncbi:MAG: bifunctional diaminohydroxyphosphoribosylaminopyrimidine deaminase/5-amino-6-(5-phosphoribosylamino)uracil reductase RibD [Pseudomonadota bacterium]
MELIQIENFMREAMAEGRKARAHCAPNPPIGCVLVQAGEIIARGHTNPPGQPHAEAMALQSLPEDAADVIAFATLEPCSFHGRTPSCAKALVKAGIKSVYVGIIDPHPKNQGAGIQILQDAGVEVHIGILSTQIQAELGPYLLHSE